MDTIYFDWSLHRGVATLTNDDSSLSAQVFPSLAVMLDSLHEPHRIIGEATFESFNLDARREFIDRCEREGHDLLTVPNRQTGRWRRRMGFGEKTTQSAAADIEDVRVIREEAREGMHLKRPSVNVDPDFAEKRAGLARLMVDLRARGEHIKRPRSAGYSFVPQKDHVAALLRDQLPDYDAQPEVRRQALGDGTSYSKTILVAVWATARVASNRDEFERLAGFYAHGYPSQVRSDLMFWGWTGGQMRQRLDKGVREKEHRGVRVDGITLSDYRREVRWLYHQLKSIDLSETGTSVPAMGLCNPSRFNSTSNEAA